ncbi:hypothetical protein SAMN05518866_14016 [Sphingobium sp. YR768]|nr:hypothetical protein SAMN05518866_14016 [Sphingobium sp. YR768]
MSFLWDHWDKATYGVARNDMAVSNGICLAATYFPLIIA